ncbi:hypothetical protein FOC4_g10006266 [Fusarium odoratissimum]|uniref:Uncharacterized protein n=1 Tax=Fusarium oxysporum f. sp. cubense (strain race 4) TaxID=2502994 RepID=N1RBG9_FUSC4|nr:hypothetical protein FOC4_g10006266 [Fusarium odoratissimum]
MKISFVPLAFVAALAGFGEARNCTPKLDHCGHFLLDIGESLSSSPSGQGISDKSLS